MSDRERQIETLRERIVRAVQDHVVPRLKHSSAAEAGKVRDVVEKAVDQYERELDAAVPSEVTDGQVERESKALYRRLQTFWWRDGSWENAGGGMQDAIRVAMRAALEAAGGADERHREAVGKAIYEEALQQIVDGDPSARDAMLIAAKALGDTSEYQNTGKVRWRPPKAAGVQPTEEEGDDVTPGFSEIGEAQDLLEERYEEER